MAVAGLSRLSASLVLALAVAACATTPVVTPPLEPAPTPVPPVEPAPTPPSSPTGPGPESLPGWSAEDHQAAFMAYVASCGPARDTAGRARCEEGRALARTSRPVTPAAARRFFEQGFTVVAAETADGRPGLMTSYFAPEYAARRAPGGEFDRPILALPASTAARQADRAAIEAGPPPGEVLGWMRAEDLFFMQIQGSGYLTFEDGGHARAAYAGDNGKTFVGIARPMAEQGLLPRDGTSGEAIRGWLAAHRGPEAAAVMALNPRYIFFRTDPDDGGDPAGAAGVPLTARRSIAVDPSSWRYGDLVWIEADAGNLVGARSSYRGLVTALDTGSAIRGPVRADFYMGRGHAAGEEAGTVRHPLRMWRLVPRD